MRKSKKHVLFFTDTRGEVGGDLVFIADLLPRLIEQGFTPTIVGGPQPKWDALLRESVPAAPRRRIVRMKRVEDSSVIRVLKRPRTAAISRVEPQNGTRPAKNTNNQESFARRLVSAPIRLCILCSAVIRLYLLFRASNAGVLHVNNGGYPAATNCRAAAISGRLAGMRVIHWFHNIPAEPAWPRPVEQGIDWLVFRSTDTWVTGARVAREAFLRLYPPASDSRVEVVYLGRPLQEYRKMRSDKTARPSLRIAAIGLLQERKGHAVLIDAVGRLKQSGVRIDVLIAGEGGQRANLEDKIAHLGLQDQIELLGFRDDIPQLLEQVDLLVHPSLDQELLPYSIKEAMQAGLPVIASNAGGISELVQNEVTGYLVRPNSVNDLVAAIQSFLRSSSLLVKFGDAGRSRIESEFTSEEMVARMIEIYAG